MNNYKETYETVPQWQRDQYNELVKSIPLEELSDIEKGKILYLAGDDWDTVETFKGIFTKLKKK